MSKSTTDLVRIAAAGGGMNLSGSKSTTDIIRICKAASNNGASITIINADSKSTTDLVRIANAGQGCVTFDFST